MPPVRYAFQVEDAVRAALKAVGIEGRAGPWGRVRAVLPEAPWEGAPKWVTDTAGADGQWAEGRVPPGYLTGRRAYINTNAVWWRVPGLDRMVVIRSGPGRGASAEYRVAWFDNDGVVPEHSGVEARTMADVRAYLNDHWRINNPTPEEERARAEAETARQEAARVQAAEDRVRWEREQEEASVARQRWAAEGAARDERDRASGAWLDDPKRFHVPKQLAELIRAAVANGSTTRAESWDVMDKARMKRSDGGGSWTAAVQFALSWSAYQREAARRS